MGFSKNLVGSPGLASAYSLAIGQCTWNLLLQIREMICTFLTLMVIIFCGERSFPELKMVE